MGSGTHFCLGTRRVLAADVLPLWIVFVLLLMLPALCEPLAGSGVGCGIWLFQSFSGVISRAAPATRPVDDVASDVGRLAAPAATASAVLVSDLVGLRAAVSAAAFLPSVGQSPTFEKSLA